MPFPQTVGEALPILVPFSFLTTATHRWAILFIPLDLI
jgi:hypothetical protein